VKLEGDERIMNTQNKLPQITLATTEQLKQAIREVLQEFHEQPAYLNARKAAKYLGVSESFILKAKNSGLLKCYQPTSNGTVRFTRQHLEDFMRRRNGKQLNKYSQHKMIRGDGQGRKGKIIHTRGRH